MPMLGLLGSKPGSMVIVERRLALADRAVEFDGQRHQHVEAPQLRGRRGL